jgi:hypothetical protein
MKPVSQTRGVIIFPFYYVYKVYVTPPGKDTCHTPFLYNVSHVTYTHNLQAMLYVYTLKVPPTDC